MHQEAPHQEPLSCDALAVSEDPRVVQSAPEWQIFGTFRLFQKLGSLDMVSDEDRRYFQVSSPWRSRSVDQSAP
eukprot:1910442-Pyramimonas_sp.AAC.1